MNENCIHWFYLCLTLCGVILAMLTMFFNYSLRLDARTVKLEKKNGHEQEQINQLTAQVKKLEKKLSPKTNTLPKGRSIKNFAD